MHVLHVYKDYPPVLGGIEGHLRRLAEGEARRGLEVTVLVTGPRWRSTVARERGVEVIRAGRWGRLASTPLGPALPRRLAALRPDVTHLHHPYPLGEAAHLLCGRSRATVVTYHSDIVRQRWLGRLYAPLLTRLLRRADRILVTSAEYLATSARLAPFRDRCTVVPLGIDTERFATPDAAAVAALRARWPGPLLLFVGRLRYYKGLDVLIAAMEAVPATLLVAGDGPLRRAWSRLASRSSAAPRIHFLGDVAEADLPPLYAAADLYVLPSTHRSEAYGLALAEALAAGTPAVTTELGTATSVLNRHGETGLVVPPADANALAAAFSGLLADPARCAAMGRRAREWAHRELPAEAMVTRTVAVYEEALASRG